MRVDHVAIGDCGLCGAPLTECEYLANGSPAPAMPCGDCAALAHEMRLRGSTHRTAAPASAASAQETVDNTPWTLPAPLHVVISMTSVPARIASLDVTVDSLCAQTRRPEQVRIYLGPGCAIYQHDGVVCSRVCDRGPVTKLSAVTDPCVRANAVIVTVDDDIVFHRDWLQTLLAAVVAYPDEAIGMAGWNAEHLIRGGRFERASGPCDVIEGFAGVAYRKWFFGPDVLEPPPHMQWVDDVWISTYLHRAGITRRVIPGEQTYINKQHSLDSGLHTRPDFIALNTRAVMDGFPRTALLMRKQAAAYA